MTPAARDRLRPDRCLERDLLVDAALVGGVDEVGRGALAGPVSVGVAIVSRETPDAFPRGLADSKQLSAPRRRALVMPLRQWLEDWAVAHATSAEIDAYGITGALHLAGQRALAEVSARGHTPEALILDGVSDWLRPQDPQASRGGATEAPDLLSGLGPAVGLGVTDLRTGLHDVPGQVRGPGWAGPRVHLRARADATCAVVAAASVLAKVERDSVMTQLEDPGYGWASNKGYASAAHVEALGRLGASEHHRRSWRLPGLSGPRT
ncbi:ribonuclease HII [Actinomyces lilanjuaniae]|uniref:Ribonuclease n=1 Tax=Actinomyces lilanjuaniae TaxID=2321394 RepID=A0ABN5PMR2_9ACTO|nr:ribonuclease HII [Actinomyces lilanjuaniae]AYD89546.1 ribonuclease HII [Actinomyces lilanjuaniae]